MNTHFVPADHYLDNLEDAKTYLRSRSPLDEAMLRKEMQFKFITPYVLRCEIYGHSLLVELVPCTLHTFPVACEFRPLGEDDPVCLDSIDQAFAYILAKNW